MFDVYTMDILYLEVSLTRLKFAFDSEFIGQKEITMLLY